MEHTIILKSLEVCNQFSRQFKINIWTILVPIVPIDGRGSKRSDPVQGGESHEFKTTIKTDTFEKTIDLGSTFFEISVNTGQICM